MRETDAECSAAATAARSSPSGRRAARIAGNPPILWPPPRPGPPQWNSGAILARPWTDPPALGIAGLPGATSCRTPCPRSSTWRARAPGTSSPSSTGAVFPARNRNAARRRCSPIGSGRSDSSRRHSSRSHRIRSHRARRHRTRSHRRAGTRTEQPSPGPGAGGRCRPRWSSSAWP